MTKWSPLLLHLSRELTASNPSPLIVTSSSDWWIFGSPKGPRRPPRDPSGGIRYPPTFTHCFFPTFDVANTKRSKRSSSASRIGNLQLDLEAVWGPPNEIIVHCQGDRYGIFGFGSGTDSLPSQTGLKRFSYCLPTRKQDGYRKKSESRGLSYTPLYSHLGLHYVNLVQVVVGDTHVKIPKELVGPGSDGGAGGTIVDVGTTFTFTMEWSIFKAVAKEFEKQMGNWTLIRTAAGVENLGPCFSISEKIKNQSSSFPELSLEFEGGAKMVLPWRNLFILFRNDSDSGAACLSFVTDNVHGSGSSGGPTIILGNYQQHSFYMEFDLENQRLGFQEQVCFFFGKTPGTSLLINS